MRRSGKSNNSRGSDLRLTAAAAKASARMSGARLSFLPAATSDRSSPASRLSPHDNASAVDTAARKTSSSLLKSAPAKAVAQLGGASLSGAAVIALRAVMRADFG